LAWLDFLGICALELLGISANLRDGLFEKTMRVFARRASVPRPARRLNCGGRVQNARSVCLDLDVNQDEPVLSIRAMASKQNYNAMLDAMAEFRSVHYGWARNIPTEVPTILGGLAVLPVCSG
jgi:hypothetical protein